MLANGVDRAVRIGEEAEFSRNELDVDSINWHNSVLIEKGKAKVELDVKLAQLQQTRSKHGPNQDILDALSQSMRLNMQANNVASQSHITGAAKATSRKLKIEQLRKSISVRAHNLEALRNERSSQLESRQSAHEEKKRNNEYKYHKTLAKSGRFGKQQQVKHWVPI